MGKSTISMAIFNCYVSSPAGNHPKPLWTLDCFFFSLRLVLDDSDDWIVETPMKKVAAKGSFTQFAPLVFGVLAAYQVHEVTDEWGLNQQDLRP